MDYAEQEDFTLFSIHYKATREQANAIFLELQETPTWLEFEEIDTQLRYGEWILSAFTQAPFNVLCRRRAALWREMNKLAAELVAKHSGDR